ncbi:MAG: hypothetical protein RR449_04370 [Christensenella sp.]
MMQNTIEMLYNGKFYPAERMIPKNKVYRGKFRDNGELKEVFASNLSDSMKVDFEVIIQNHLDMTSLETEQTFVDGFQLGARLMLEILEVGDDE